MQAVGLPLPVDIMIGCMVPLVGVAMWFTIHKSKGALMMLHGSAPPKPQEKGLDKENHESR